MNSSRIGLFILLNGRKHNREVGGVVTGADAEFTSDMTA